MSEATEHEILAVLKEIRDGQRTIITHLEAQRGIAEDQLRKSQARVQESVDLQREALRRQRTVTLFAIPGILACIAAIAYLVLRYF